MGSSASSRRQQTGGSIGGTADGIPHVGFLLFECWRNLFPFFAGAGRIAIGHQRRPSVRFYTKALQVILTDLSQQPVYPLPCRRGRGLGRLEVAL